MNSLNFYWQDWNRFPRQHIGGPTIPPKLAEALRSWRELHRIWPLGDYAEKACCLAAAIDSEPLLK